MFENIINFFKNLGKKEKKKESSGTAKERLHLVLMQDRANVSADFLELMKQEIIEVIKKYIDIDEKSIDVRLTNKTNDDGTVGAPALYANIPIVTIKNEARIANVPNKNKDNKVVEKTEKIDENKKTTESKEKKEQTNNPTEGTETKKDETAKTEIVENTKETAENENTNKEEKDELEKETEDKNKIQSETEKEKTEEGEEEQKNKENEAKGIEHQEKEKTVVENA